MASSLLFVILFMLLLTSASAKIRPKTDLSIIEGQGFVVYLEEEEAFGKISNCWFKFQDDNSIEIDLTSNNIITTNRGELIRKFSKTNCGIRVDNVAKTSIGTWNLRSMNFSSSYVNDSVRINILTAPKGTLHTIVEKPLGQNTVTCTKQDYTKVCKLIETSSKNIWNQCEIFTKINNESNYECRTLSWGSMNESVEKINLRIAPVTEFSEASIEETDDHYVLRCFMKATSVQSCKAELPDRLTQFYIADGLSNGKYSTYDTLLSQSKCALEIPKPLEVYENGLWKIIQHSDSGLLGTGCLFYVGTSSKEAIIKEELKRQQDEDNSSSNSIGYQDHTNRVDDDDDVGNGNSNKDDDDLTTLLRRRKIELYSTERTISEITCTVPFVVDDCYLRDSKNTLRFPDSGRFQRSRALGICTFINVPSMPGVWSCGLRGSDYKGHVVQDIEVSIESELGRAVTGIMRIGQHEPLELMCKSPFGEPVSRCAYVSPTSQVHLVASNTGGTKLTGRVQYFGKGIEKGDCGMRIKTPDAEDFGEWSCQFQNVNNGATLSNFTIFVNPTAVQSQFSWYAILGIVLGAAVIVILLIGTVTFGYKKLRQTPNSDSGHIEGIGMSIRE